MTAIDTWIAQLLQFRRSATVEPLWSDIFDTVVPALQYINGIVSGVNTYSYAHPTISGASYTPPAPLANIVYSGFNNTSGGAITYNIPVSFNTNNQQILIQDEGWNAGVNNVTIQPAGGALIYNAASIKLTVNGQGVALIYSSTAFGGTGGWVPSG